MSTLRSASRPDAHEVRYGGRLLGGASCALPVDSRPAADETDSLGPEEQLVKVCTTIEGMLDGCQYLPMFYLMKDEFGLGPVDISLTFGIAMVPWILKPLLALLSDRVPICGRRRTPYMVAGVVIIAGSLVGVNLATSYTGTLTSFVGLTVGRSMLSAVVQAMLVEVGRPRGHAGITALVGDFFVYRSGGALFSAILTTAVVSHFGPRMAFKVALLLPACLLGKVAHYEMVRGRDEPGGVPDHLSISSGFGDLRTMLKQPAVWGPLAFLFLYNAGPNYDDPLYVYFINELHFEPYMVGQIVVVHTLAKVIGVVLYRYALRGIEDRKLIVGLTVLSCPLLLSPLLLTTGLYQTMHINPRFLALSGELVREVFLHLQMMPAMARWVQLAPKHSEGAVLSMLIATMQFSRAFSKGSSAMLTASLGVTATNFDNISVLIAICGASVLVPIIFAKDLIPDQPELSSDPDQAASGPAALTDGRSGLESVFDLRGDARIVPAG